MLEDIRKIDLQFFADDPDEGDNTETQGKTFTQAELDAIIAKRLARDRKAWEEQLEEEKKKATMTEIEKLKAEHESKAKDWQAKLETANAQILRSEIKAIAAEIGIVDPDIAYLMIKDNVGEDLDNVKTLLEDLIKSKPYLKKQATDIGGGTNPPFDSNIENPFKRGPSFNLTKQAELWKKNPALAKVMQAEAKK